MTKGKSLSYVTHGAIIALRGHTQMSFADIASVLDLLYEIVRNTYNRILEQAEGVEIRELLKAADMSDKKRNTATVLQTFPPISELSERLKSLVTQDEEHWLRTFPQIAQVAGMMAVDSTIY
ncbi:hypothetical protein HOY82DRAFT_607794 [Tuber indicum]|nr:hypothetical protein HOY82DRAFT_607794 [Tuber indicum]